MLNDHRQFDELRCMEEIKSYEVVNAYEAVRKQRIHMDTKSKATHDDILFEYVKELQGFIKQDGYPCVGARTAVNSNSLTVGVFKKIADSDTAKEVAFGLMEYIERLKGKPSNYLTFVAIFPFDSFDDEQGFEDGLWHLLNELHELDREHYRWSPEVSKNPEDAQFSFSFGEEGFFIVGLHPESSRKARRFKYPAIAFNLHGQFENLRKKGRYDVMRDAIRNNEMDFDGSINPMLNDFGDGLEAPQYSGRQVNSNWKCPFNGK